MANYEYNVKIGAPTEAQADTKMEALMTMAAHLDAATLKAFANVLTTDPGKVRIAKSFLGIKE